MFLEISQNSQENTCGRVSFLIERSATLLKKDSSTGVFLWILRNFEEHLFYRTPPGDYFRIKSDIRNQWFHDKSFAKNQEDKQFKNVTIFKDALSGLRQFLATKSYLKMMKNAFYFTSKPLFVLKIFKFRFDYLIMYKNDLIRKTRLILKFMMSQPG